MDSSFSICSPKHNQIEPYSAFALFLSYRFAVVERIWDFDVSSASGVIADVSKRLKTPRAGCSIWKLKCNNLSNAMPLTR